MDVEEEKKGESKAKAEEEVEEADFEEVDPKN